MLVKAFLEYRKTKYYMETIQTFPITLEYKKILPEAFDLDIAYTDDLGFDVRTPIDICIRPRNSATIDTGVAIKIPSLINDFLPDLLAANMLGQDTNIASLAKICFSAFKIGCFVKSKSGLSVNHNLEHGAGVIDPGYRDTLKIKIYNHSDNYYAFKRGDKIAQLTFPVLANVTPVHTTRDWEETERGDKGFGSSGK